MNKRNKILVGCLSLLLVLSVGYALFSETVTINGTATAKGSFDIIGTCQTGVPTELVSGVEYQFDDEGFVEVGYKNDSCSITGNEGSLSVELEYPGAKRYFTIKFTNNGTIPATINNLEVKKYYVCLDGTCNDTDPFDNSGTSVEQQIKDRLELFSYNFVVVGIQEGNGTITPYDKITQTQAAEFLDANGNYILKPGNSSFVAIRAYLNKNIGSENGGSIEISNEVTYSFPFTQITIN